MQVSELNTKGDNNRSVRETKARIQRTFLELLRKKHYTKISVREIAESANINRSTFYLHYKDVYDLLEKIEDDFAGQIAAAVKKIRREGYVPGEHPQHTGVFEVMNRNKDLFRILMSSNGDVGFLRKITDTISEALRFSWNQAANGRIPKTLDIDMYVSYVAHGMVGVFMASLAPGDTRSPREMGHFAGEVTEWIDETFVRTAEIEKK